jgi:hypothetical protein
MVAVAVLLERGLGRAKIRVTAAVMIHVSCMGGMTIF